MHSSSTVFPTDIDPRKYYSNITLTHTDILNGYVQLNNRGQYKEASQYLYDNIEVPDLDVDYYGSYMWNSFDNRIVSIEDYAIEMEPTEARNIYSSTEPTEQPIGKVWVS